MIKDSFKDILKHTHGLSFLPDAKITGTDESTTIGAIAEDKSVVLYGKLNTPLSDLSGHVIGLARMSVLHGYLSFPAFNTKEANISVTVRERNGVSIPSELKFKSGNGHNATYRFMGPEAANDITIPKFREPSWAVTVTPTQENLKDLAYFGGILGGFEPSFTVIVNNGTLEFHIGTSGDKSVVPMATGITASLTSNHSYPLAKVLSILKLSDAGACTIKFSDQGALMITINSGIGEYEYIVPASMH